MYNFTSFDSSGVDVGKNTENMTRLYGLSDFFGVLFEDTETVNLLMEANALEASEIYSKFLQLTSSISLEGIQTVTQSQIKLVMLKNTDRVDGTPAKYALPESFQATKFVANRPFLPTGLLEENIDYQINQDDSGQSYITFARPLNQYPFSSRAKADGSTEYAMWFVDSNIDEQMMAKFYGNLLAITPENSSEEFSNFVYGLYFVYTHGPALAMIRRGLNLVLGIPLARSTEAILDVRTYLETDQYIVITDQNQYLIPYGLAPSAEIGETISVGDELAQWIEVKDFVHDGAWWLNLHIPEKIVPVLPVGQPNRYSIANSHLDALMRNYLKKHTFLVKARVDAFKNVQRFAQIMDIVEKSKPAYTQAIYVWTVASQEEILLLNDDALKLQARTRTCDHVGESITRFYRGNTVDPILRGCPSFIRISAGPNVPVLIGNDPILGNKPEVIGPSRISGFRNPAGGFRANTPAEKGWINALTTRGSDSWRGIHAQIGWGRKTLAGVTYGVPDRKYKSALGIPHGSMRAIPLYATTFKDVVEKFNAVGLDAPNSYEWVFDIFGPRSTGQAVNDRNINAPFLSSDGSAAKYFTTLFFRSDAYSNMGNVMPQAGYRTWAPQVTDVQSGDYILGVHITDSVVGMYWVTTNMTVFPPTVYAVEDMDHLEVVTNRPIDRAGAAGLTPYYLARGIGYISAAPLPATNEIAINEGTSNSSASQVYSDEYNTSVPISRTGTTLVHRQRTF